MAVIDFKKASDIESIESNIFGKLVLTMANQDMSDPLTWRLAGAGWVFIALGSVFGIVVTFLRKHTLGWAAGAALFAVTVIIVILQPSLESANGNDPQITGIGVAFFGVLGMLLLVLVHTVFKPKVNPGDVAKGL